MYCIIPIFLGRAIWSSYLLLKLVIPNSAFTANAFNICIYIFSKLLNVNIISFSTPLHRDEMYELLLDTCISTGSKGLNVKSRPSRRTLVTEESIKFFLLPNFVLFRRQSKVEINSRDKISACSEQRINEPKMHKIWQYINTSIVCPISIKLARYWDPRGEEELWINVECKQ